MEKQIIVIRIENPSVSPLNRLVWLLKLQDYGSIIHWGCVLWLDFGWKREESCTTLAIKLQKNTSFDFSTSNSFAFVIPRRWKYKEGLDRVFIIRASIPQNYIPNVSSLLEYREENLLWTSDVWPNYVSYPTELIIISFMEYCLGATTQ